MRLKLNRTLILLSLCCLALIAVIVHQLEDLGGPVPPVRADAKKLYKPEMTLKPFPKQKQERFYTAINQKPLFFSSRKPVPKQAKAKPKAAPVKKPKLTILGTITDADQPIALIQLGKKAGVKSYRQGDKIREWTIDTITPFYLVLKFDDVEARYTLSNYPSLPSGSSAPKIEEGAKENAESDKTEP